MKKGKENMEQQKQHILKTIVHDNNINACNLSAQMVQLEVVQGAVARLMDKIDKIIHDGWDRDFRMAYMSINEIQDTLRLIDMGFRPLFKEMSEEVNTLKIHADKLFETVIKSEKEELINDATKVDINSIIG